MQNQTARVCACVFVCLLILDRAALAQNQNGGPPKKTEEGWTATSIPTVAPVTQEGAGLALQYRYHLNSQNKKNTSSSGTAFGGFVTTNRSWGIGGAQRFYFQEDRWRSLALATYMDVRYNFYGLGTAAGDEGTSVLMRQKGFGGLGELMYGVHELWYAGAQYRALKVKSDFRDVPAFDSSTIDPDQLNVRIAGVGPRVIRDSRNDTDYPIKGSLFDFRALLHDDAVGSELTYQLYTLSYNKYVSITPSQVLAVRGASCLARGDVPFFNEWVLTTAQNLRGYRASRYMDNVMVASQAEYRVEIWRRVGAVGFFGVGEVAPRIPDLTWGDVRPGGGVGVRLRLTNTSRVNARFDYAWGRDSRQAYFFFGEAF
jgi:hypothetical protein